MHTSLGRIRKDIEALSAFNSSPGEGLTRFSLTEADRGAREYLRVELEKLELKVYEDSAGSIFGKMEGTDPDAPAIMIGSHFDSVKNGGNFDGPAGIVMGLEIMRVLKEKNIKTKYPIEFVGMIEEEGGRFGAGVFGSRAMAGKVKYEDLKKNKDKNGISMAEAFEAFGFDPHKIDESARKSEDLKAFIELHIEQGPVLENGKTDLGLVDFIVGISEFRVKVIGRSDHAGTTPMLLRKDALGAASELISEIGNYAIEAGQGTVATVGVLDVKPGAANIVPGEVEFTVDIRSKSVDCMAEVRAAVERKLQEVSQKRGVSFEIEDLLKVDPVIMDAEILSVLKEKAVETGFSHKVMTSGAGHDAMIMAAITPTGLVFVPSRDGRSHCPEEWTDYEDLQKGIEVICHTIIEMGETEQCQ